MPRRSSVCPSPLPVGTCTARWLGSESFCLSSLAGAGEWRSARRRRSTREKNAAPPHSTAPQTTPDTRSPVEPQAMAPPHAAPCGPTWLGGSVTAPSTSLSNPSAARTAPTALRARGVSAGLSRTRVEAAEHGRRPAWRIVRHRLPRSAATMGRGLPPTSTTRAEAWCGPDEGSAGSVEPSSRCLRHPSGAGSKPRGAARRASRLSLLVLLPHPPPCGRRWIRGGSVWLSRLAGALRGEERSTP